MVGCVNKDEFSHTNTVESLKLGEKLIMWSKRQIVESALWIFVIYLSNFNVDGEKLIP